MIGTWLKLDLDRIGTELGQKAKIEENPPKPEERSKLDFGKSQNRGKSPKAKKKEAS